MLKKIYLYKAQADLYIDCKIFKLYIYVMFLIYIPTKGTPVI